MVEERKSRKKKRTTLRKRKKGITSHHIVKSDQGAIDTLDKQGKNGFYIVMDNCKSHHTAFIVDAINNRGYHLIPLFFELSWRALVKDRW